MTDIPRFLVADRDDLNGRTQDGGTCFSDVGVGINKLVALESALAADICRDEILFEGRAKCRKIKWDLSV